MSANTPGPLVSSGGCRACPGPFSCESILPNGPLHGGQRSSASALHVPKSQHSGPSLRTGSWGPGPSSRGPPSPTEPGGCWLGPRPTFPAPCSDYILVSASGPPTCAGLPGPLPAVPLFSGRWVKHRCAGKGKGLGWRMELPGPRGAGGLACSCAFASRPRSPHRSPGRGSHPSGQPSAWRLSSEGPALETSQKPQLSVFAGSPQALHPWRRPLGVVTWLDMFQGTGRGAGLSAGRAQAGPPLRPDFPAPYRTRGRWANTMTGGLRGPAWGSDGSVCGESQLCNSGQRD